MNDCLIQIFFEENEEILSLKLEYQYDTTGSYFEQISPDDPNSQNEIVSYIL